MILTLSPHSNAERSCSLRKYRKEDQLGDFSRDDGWDVRDKGVGILFDGIDSRVPRSSLQGVQTPLNKRPSSSADDVDYTVET
jgi:hypothetical protein